MRATHEEYRRALSLALEIEHHYPDSAAAGVDRVKVGLSRVCLSYLTDSQGPEAEPLFQQALGLIARSAAPAPEFEVLSEDEQGHMKVRTESGRLYLVARDEGGFVRGERRSTTLEGVMVGTA